MYNTPAIGVRECIKSLAQCVCRGTLSRYSPRSFVKCNMFSAFVPKSSAYVCSMRDYTVFFNFSFETLTRRTMTRVIAHFFFSSISSLNFFFFHYSTYTELSVSIVFLFSIVSKNLNSKSKPTWPSTTLSTLSLTCARRREFKSSETRALVWERRGGEGRGGEGKGHGTFEARPSASGSTLRRTLESVKRRIYIVNFVAMLSPRRRYSSLFIHFNLVTFHPVRARARARSHAGPRFNSFLLFGDRIHHRLPLPLSIFGSRSDRSCIVVPTL